MRTQERPLLGARPGRSVSAPRLIYLLIVLIVLLAAYLFINSSYFEVGTVIIEGNKFMPVEDVLRAAGVPEKVNIFRLNSTDIKNRLLRDLRVGEVEVFRRFPATIVIQLKERTPLALVASNYGFVELDKPGTVLAAQKNIKQLNIPVVTGVNLGNIYVGDTVKEESVLAVLEYLSALDEDTLNDLSEVNISASGELIAYTVQTATIRLGSKERLAEKAKLTKDILQDIGDRKAAVDYIDLQYASPYIKFRQ
ncbi:MAG: ftsQ [Firmicutes bacterium]|nr:ftsQ [Bacillota bacterium]